MISKNYWQSPEKLTLLASLVTGKFHVISQFFLVCFFSKCEQICPFLWIYSYLLKELLIKTSYLMEQQVSIFLSCSCFSWFHQHLSRHQAEALLMQNGENGSYLLRESSTNLGEYSLSVRSLNAVKHFQIGWDGRVFKFGMGRFNNLEDFTKHFQNQPLIGGESGI